jgi:hypothetical protein
MEQYIQKIESLGISDTQKAAGFSKGPSKMVR